MSGRRDSFKGLPGILREIAEVAGLEAAMKLAWSYGGGAKVKIPSKAGSGHWLVKCVGREAADAICDYFSVGNADGKNVGNYHVYIPLAGTGLIAQGRKRLVKDLNEGKMTVHAAARRTGFTERTAYRIKRKLETPGSKEQPDLFGPPSLKPQD